MKNTTFLLVCTIVLTSCSFNKHLDIAQAPRTPVLTRPATPGECPTGGTVVMIGPQTINVCNGLSGTPGVDGQDGSPGADGQQGPKGDSGPAGSPGTQVEMVKLCPGVPSYPGVFVEYAIRIGTDVYAVYSTHGGFLTLLPPGTYASHAVGSACDLTVHEDGTVTN